MAGELQPGDHTKYAMVVVEKWDCYDVVVLNNDFFDRLIFLKKSLSSPVFYVSERGEKTNPWTIKAAQEMIQRFLGAWKEENIDAKSNSRT